MGIKVKLPMILYLDNKGAKDSSNNWSIGGRTRHIEAKQYFLRELKEANLSFFIGKDKYMVDDFDTHKRRVFEVNNCEYQAGAYIPPGVVKHYMEHVNIMTPILG
eukprot:7698231-Ditylum_brightwellii.AAC.1